MARPLRIEFPGAFYHVLNRGVERREIFCAPRDYRDFLDLLGRARQTFRIVLHAYALLPNHYHLFLQTPDGHLARAMRHLDGVYTQAFNRRYGRVGPLFQGRYKAILVDQDQYALELCRYIHRNPVRAGLAAGPEVYPWSSYRAYVGHEPAPAGLDVAWVLGQLAPALELARSRLQQFTRDGAGAEAWEPAAVARGGVVLGSEAFCEGIRRRVGAQETGPGPGELSGLRELRKVRSVRPIVQAVHGLTPDAKLRRKLLVYALRRFTPLSLKETGERLRGMSYQAVAQTVFRLREQRKRDAALDGLLVKLEAACCEL